MNQARYDDAKVLLEATLARQRETFEGPHEDTAVTLNTLGNVNHYLGKLEEAEAYYSEALDMHRETLGDAHPFVATDLMNMAALLNRPLDLDLRDRSANLPEDGPRSAGRTRHREADGRIVRR